MNLNNTKVLRERNNEYLNESLNLKNYSIISGNYSQADFSNGDTQCTAICAIFIVKSFISKIEDFNSKTIDHILFLGNNYYQSVRDAKFIKENLLTVQEITGEIYIENSLVILSIDESNFSFILNNKFSLKNIKNAIIYFKNNNYNYSILTLNNYSFALFKQIDKSVIYFFNSHKCDNIGYLNENGKACLLKFSGEKCAENLAEFIFNFFYDSKNIQFSLEPVYCKLVENNYNNRIHDVSVVLRHQNKKIKKENFE